MDIPIIFEDNSFLIIDKPSGIVVNRSENAPAGTIQDWVEKELRTKNLELRTNNEDFIKRLGIVHRIDKETSGLLVIAKNSEAFENLQKQFLSREVTKKYLALVHGKIVPVESSIKAPVGRLPWNRRKFGVLPEGREAETAYKVIEHYSRNREVYSYLEVIPHTGRTHQIRIHLKYLGFPLVSDPLYTPQNVCREDRKWCPRLFLHAAYLRLKHPKTEEWMEFKSNLSEELRKVLSKLC